MDAVVAAVWATLAWPSLRTKKISKNTLVRLPWYSMIYSTMVGVAAPEDKHGADSFCGVKNDDLLANSFTRTAFLSLMGRDASEGELFEFQVLLGLIITNGPGTISAQGSKGAVSADGPEQPDRVQINKSFIGFLTHTGFAHGGNGYEAAAFLIDQFKDTPLKDPADAKHGVDLGNWRRITPNGTAITRRSRRDSAIWNMPRFPASTIRCSRGKMSTSTRVRNMSANCSRTRGCTMCSSISTITWWKACSKPR